MKKLTTLEDLKTIPISYRNRYTKPKVVLSIEQQRMYNIYLKGLQAYDKEYIKGLSHSDKKQIIYKHAHTWRIINKLKQDKLNELLRQTILNIIPNITGNAIEFLLMPINDSTFIIANIKEITVSTSIIVEELIKENVLPKDFYQL